MRRCEYLRIRTGAKLQGPAAQQVSVANVWAGLARICVIRMRVLL